MRGEWQRPAEITAPGHYTGVFFDAAHQFDRSMRNPAFSWRPDTGRGQLPRIEAYEKNCKSIDVFTSNA